MAATDAPSTLSELATDFLENIKDVTSSTAITNLVYRFLNRANQDIHQERWWWAERRSVILTKPPYTTGTVSVTKGATAVTGASTAWTTADSFGNAQAAAGEKITLGSTTDVYVIDSVSGATALTLASRFTGETLSAASHVVFQDEYALASDFDDVVDTRTFSEDHDIDLIGAQEFYRRFARNSVGGTPEVATLIELGPSGSASLRRRVLLGPRPDRAYTIPYRYYTTNLAVSSTGVGAVNITATTDQPIIPIRFRQALVYRAMAAWYQTRKKDPEAATQAMADYTTVMLRARAATGPTEDGVRMVPRVGSYWRMARRPWRRGGSTRLTTGTAWDQLRQ
jgi:hypothetical protein